MVGTTIFSDYLKALGVKHTGCFSDREFHRMPFKSLFGFSRLLTGYGIDNQAYRFTDKSQLSQIPTPFIAQKNDGEFVIVNSVTDNAVDYTLYHKRHSVTRQSFADHWTGVALIAYPSEKSEEPSYGRHHFFEIIDEAKTVLMVGCIAALFITGFIYQGLYSHFSTWALMAVDLAGIYITWMLILKTLKINNHSADKICGVLQEHGCDHVLEQKASSFFGIFSWSEVGITYFSVTTFITLAFPHTIPTLALINALCLPFTVWSIWYQKFRIKTWCTLCLTTQCLLWLQFFCYVGGGWWKETFPLSPWFWLMGCAYVAVLMAVNRLMTFIKHQNPSAPNS